MSSKDGRTDIIEAIAIGIAILIGLSFLIYPSTASLPGIVDIIDILPNPGAVGTKGQLGGVIAIILGLAGVVRRYLRNGPL